MFQFVSAAVFTRQASFIAPQLGPECLMGLSFFTYPTCLNKHPCEQEEDWTTSPDFRQTLRPVHLRVVVVVEDGGRLLRLVLLRQVELCRGTATGVTHSSGPVC